MIEKYLHQNHEQKRSSSDNITVSERKNLFEAIVSKRQEKNNTYMKYFAKMHSTVVKNHGIHKDATSAGVVGTTLRCPTKAGGVAKLRSRASCNAVCAGWGRRVVKVSSQERRTRRPESLLHDIMERHASHPG